jgi:hypothetical protein
MQSSWPAVPALRPIPSGLETRPPLSWTAAHRFQINNLVSSSL